MRTRRHHRAFARTLIAACAAALCVFPSGSAGAANPHDRGGMLQNGSFEQWSGSTPTCWLLGGYGTNTYQWTHLTGNDAYNGRDAIDLDISSLTSGDRKLLTAFNSSCSPAVSAGHQYTVDVWYKSNSRPVFFAFRSNLSSGGWSFWAQSSQLPPAAGWTHAQWTTPVIPDGTSFLSVGLGLQVTGSLEMDDFSMADTTGSSPSDSTPPSTSISCNSAPCASYYNGPVTIALGATDNAGGSGVAQIRYTTDGTAPTATSGYLYSGPFSVGSNMTIKYLAVDNAGNVSPVATQTITIDQTLPTVSLTAPATGAIISGTTTFSANASDNLGVKQVDFLVDGTLVGSDPTGSPYTFSWDSSTVANGQHTVAARVIDLAGNTRTTAAVTVTASNVVVTSPGYFSTLPSQVGGLPKSDSYCAANVTTSTWEPRTDNYTANHSVPSSLSLIPWGSEMNYWVHWIAKRNLVTGNYKGTTNQIIQWAACKWGMDENLLRAVAVQESDWHESMVGDICGPVGEASYGLFQIKNKYCNGSWAWGGYDYSAKNTAFNGDFYAAYIRSCLDNDFYDGGSWLYGGKTIAQIISTNGFDYVVWGCVGSWFSGRWYDSGAKTYISSVQNHLANKDWLKY
jgi:Bacterial Ig domain/Chitobiase/beta-hexosaminidase C-terminal domain/Transglycosylase SLT domain